MPPDFAPMDFELETDRLMLRLWQESDAAWWRELVAEREGKMPDLAAARERMISARAAAVRSGIGMLALRRKDTGEFIGYCGLLVGRSTLVEPEIGYELFRRAHGHGYATEAALAVVDAAARTGRSRLWATVRPDNAASFRVLEKLGFMRHHSGWDGSGEFVWSVRELRGTTPA
jgi:RimJ/RimL family protein N-acetyltransferase